MTRGFDAATPQAGLDFHAVRGEEFVIVKAGGANVGDYVAPHYAEQIEGARAAGLHTGHYWLTGRDGSPIEQARYFVGHLHEFDRDHDLLALDNERFPEEPGSRAFSDEEQATFLAEVIRLTGIVPWHALAYGGAAALRAGGEWADTNRLGVRWWVAGYGANDGTRYPLADLPHISPAIHQYTSAGTLGGRRVDLDWAGMTAEALFGSGVVAASNAKQHLAQAKASTRTVHAQTLPKTSTEETGSPGKPGSACWKRMQVLARKGGYAGAIDGDLRVNSWKGLQRWLRDHFGYRGAIDGEPGLLTWAALQRLAAEHGYRGAIDGDPRVQTWRALGAFLNTLPGDLALAA